MVLFHIFNIFKCRFILLLITFFASCSVTRSTSSKLCALASPRLCRSSPGSWLLFQLYSILWVSVCVDTSTTGWSSLPLRSLSSRIFRLSSDFVTIGDCHQSQEVQPHTFPGSAVSVGRHRFHLFQGFSVGGTLLTAAVHSRRISVMRLAYREPVAVASRRSFLAGSPRSWRLTEGAVPPALPPSFLGPSGSGGSSVSVDDVSSRISGGGSIYLVCLSGCLSARCLLTYTFGPTPRTWDGAPISTVRSLPACGTPKETALSINARELLAVQLGLFQFRSALQGRTVAVFCDNTTAVTYLRKEGGTRSPLLNTLAQEILRWTESLSIRLAPQFLPGSDNVLADALSRPHQLPYTEWSLNMTVFLSL